MSSPAVHLRMVFGPDGVTILDTETDSLIRLNATGSFIWQALQAGKRLDEIALELASETGADPAIVKGDLRDFIAKLRSQRLLAD